LSQFRVLDLPTFSDARGMLSVIDGLLPFPMQRIYWIHGAGGNTRGGHRHGQTRQALVAIHGQVTIHMDDGGHAADVLLDSPARCLIVEPEDWHTMHFGPGAVLLVIASRTYDVNDYVDEPYPR
jgi:hypothetical protein